MVLSEPGVVKDILVTKGVITSSRKNIFVKCQTIFLWRGITVSLYNATWRKHRRIAYSYLQQHSNTTSIPVLNHETKTLVRTLFDSSKGGLVSVNPQRSIGRCFLNKMLIIDFGFRTQSLDDPTVSKVLWISREFMNCTSPVSNLVDFVPLLQYLPSTMHSRGVQLRKACIELYGGLIQDMTARMKAGEHVPDCFTKKLLGIKEEEQLDDLDVIFLSTAFMITGVDAPAGLVQWFVAHISKRPDIQEKAHEELDRVVGRDRLPMIDDHANLPYVRAIIKEVQRYHNPFWMGNPHATTEDLVYNGYYIPKNTVLILNSYSMHFSEARHADPFAFNPDRFIEDTLSPLESANLADPYKRDHWMYGAGRRICIGILLTEKETFLAISRLLWCFHMGETPKEPIDLKEYDGLSGRSPLPFKVSLTPRHANVERVLTDDKE